MRIKERTVLHPYPPSTFTPFRFYTFPPFHLSIFTLSLLLLTSCSSESTQFQPAFYHWQTRLAIDASEQHYLQALEVGRLYVKFFDVSWDAARQEAIPQASLERESGWEGYEIVPTVFITNQTLLELPEARRDQLAEKILAKINALWPALQAREIQIDCDWTNKSREGYFQLLEELRDRLPSTTQLSVTLRLHQYRHPELTGIPPADRAMLMFYNMGELTDWQEPNSILNLEKAKPYLQIASPYPVPLDLALPIFQWGVLFREGRMIKLLPKITPSAIVEIGGVPLNGDTLTRFEIPKSTYLEGYYLYQGDRIRLEEVSATDLIQAASMLRSTTNSESAFLSFYQLDSVLLTRYQTADLQECLKVLHQEIE